MLVSEVKPIGKVGKNLIENKNSDELIELIIEKPLQKACKKCKEKNIETVMSSCNKKNIVQNKCFINDVKNNKSKMKSFEDLGKGFAWLMINFNTLSVENRKILFSLQEKYGENSICFVKSNYVEVINPIRKFFRLNELVENFDDEYSKEFKNKQILLMYNNRYPRRSVFIRMPIEFNTSIEDVEIYFDNILQCLNSQ